MMHAPQGLRLILAGLLISVILLLGLNSVRAANDPGHDSLYLEQDRDNNLTGRLNISKTLEVADTIFSSYLDILGNGTQPTSSFAQIYARSGGNELVLNAPTQLVLLRDSGSLVRIGIAGVDLNVSQNAYIEGFLNVSGDIKTSGEIYTQGTKVQKRVSGTCNAGEAIQSINEDGTVNCQSTSGANSGGGWTNTSTTTSTGLKVNITGSKLEVSTGDVEFPAGVIDNAELANSALTVTAGSGLVGGGLVSLGGSITLDIGAGSGITVNADDIAIDPTYTQRRVSSCAAGQAIQSIAEDGSVTCASTTGASSGGGWTNTSTTTHTSLDVKVDTKTLVVNATDNDVGIGTANPNATLEVKEQTHSIQFDPYFTAGRARINTTGNSNLTIASSGGSIIIRLA